MHNIAGKGISPLFEIAVTIIMRIAVAVNFCCTLKPTFLGVRKYPVVTIFTPGR
jgi:hypothetical protein